MENKNEANIKSRKSNFILVVSIILLSVAIIAVIIALVHSPKDSSCTTANLNSNQKEESKPIITVIPNENQENNISQNTNEENTVENQEHNNSFVVEPETPYPSINSNENTNTNHTNSNTNTNSSSNPNTVPTLPPSNNTNTPNNENTTPKPTTPSTPTAPSVPSTPPVKPYVVKTETSTDLKTETKYGVLIKTYTTSTYDLYSDGTKKVINSSSKVEYDRTNYSATTSQLLPEARTIKSQYSSMINHVLKNVNSYRENANSQSIDDITNRKALVLNENLCVAACVRALEMGYSSKFTHTRPNGSKFYTILDEMNIEYMTAGENISYGYSDANSVSEGWKNSEAHYKNMISPKFSQIGIGVFKIDGTYYWVQIFN